MTKTAGQILSIARAKYSAHGKSLSLETSFQDLKLDSLELIEFIYEIEEEFSIDFEPSVLRQVNTLEDICHQVTAHQSKAS